MDYELKIRHLILNFFKLENIEIAIKIGLIQNNIDRIPLNLAQP